MIVKIQVDASDIIKQADGLIYLKIHHNVQFERVCFICPVKADTMEEYDQAPKALSGATVLVTQRGRLLFEKHGSR